MNIITVLLCLIGMAIITLIAGAIIVRRESRKKSSRKVFSDSVIFMRAMIEKSELNEQGYKDCLVVFREFKLMPYCNKKVYKSLVSDFLFKYRDFLSCDKADPKIKIIPDNTEGYYNYKIQV